MTVGRSVNEHDPLSIDGLLGGRSRAVNSVLALASQSVRSTSIRLPCTVHINGAGGFAVILAGLARQAGQSGYPGNRAQCWPAVHALDAAALFRIALERAEPGTVWHAAADDGVMVRDIAAVIGRWLNMPVASVEPDTYGPRIKLLPLFNPRRVPTHAKC